MSAFRAWLQLIRVAALPTALADVWLGTGTALLFWSGIWPVVSVSVIALALYTAGMILNDAHDVEEDKVHNPGRPLPSGRISVSVAKAAGFGLLFGAIAGAGLIGPWTCAVAALLALLIVCYDFILKATLLGPVNMGLCRAVNVVLGMTIADAWWPPRSVCTILADISGGVASSPFGSMLLRRSEWLLLLALWVFAYVALVTQFSRFETRKASAETLRGWLFGASVAILPVILIFVMSCASGEYIGEGLVTPWFHGQKCGLAPILVAVVTFGLFAACVTASWVCALGRRHDARAAVGFALLGIIPFQASVAAAVLQWQLALAIVLLLVPAIFLRKLSHIT